MAGINFTVESDSKVVFDRTFQDVVNLTEDFRPFWDASAPAIYQANRELIRTQGASGGATWKPLTPAYAQWKAKHYPGQGMERLTNALYESLSTRGATGNVDRRERDYAEFGSSLPWAMAQHRGVPERNLPSRLLLVMNDALQLTLQKVWQGTLVGLVKAGLAERRR